MLTLKYEKIWCRRTYSGKCSICGKAMRKTKTFYQTLNPYNTKNGISKTEPEIYEEITEEAKEYKPTFIHEKCKNKQEEKDD